jgi:Putative transposase
VEVRIEPHIGQRPLHHGDAPLLAPFPPAPSARRRTAARCLVRYMMRAPVSLSRLRFTPGSHEVVYARKGGHDEPELTEDERIDAMDFVARVLVQIPDPRRWTTRGERSRPTRLDTSISTATPTTEARWCLPPGQARELKRVERPRRAGRAHAGPPTWQTEGLKGSQAPRR